MTRALLRSLRTPPALPCRESMPIPKGGPNPGNRYNKDGHPENVPWVAGAMARPDGVPLAMEA